MLNRVSLLQLQLLQHLLLVQSSGLRCFQDMLEIYGEFAAPRVVRVRNTEETGWVALRQHQGMATRGCGADCRQEGMLN